METLVYVPALATNSPLKPFFAAVIEGDRGNAGLQVNSHSLKNILPEGSQTHFGRVSKARLLQGRNRSGAERAALKFGRQKFSEHVSFGMFYPFDSGASQLLTRADASVSYRSRRQYTRSDTRIVAECSILYTFMLRCQCSSKYIERTQQIPMNFC